MTAVKILLADDHKLFIEGLSALLSFYPHLEICGRVFQLKDLESSVHTLQPDLLLLDVNMSGESSLETGKRILQNSNTRVVLVTMYNQEKLLKEAVRAGFHGYLLKDSDKEDILLCISKVAEGRPYFDPKISAHKNTPEDEFEKSILLTFRERELIHLIRSGCTNEQMAEKLHLSVLTIKTHRRNIHFKLGVSNTAELIRYANENGI